jgi:DNA-binding MarR family transcriptional regulator
VASPAPDPTWQNGLSYLLWRAQQAMHRQVQEALEELGVTVTQFGLAVHLDDLGLMSASDLARRYHLTSQSVTTALGQLENLGWTRRRAHPVNRRVVLHGLSDAGLAHVTDGRARIAAVNQEIADTLGGNVGEQLMAGLRELTVALDGEEIDYQGAWPVVRDRT